MYACPRSRQRPNLLTEDSVTLARPCRSVGSDEYAVPAGFPRVCNSASKRTHRRGFPRFTGHGDFDTEAPTRGQRNRIIAARSGTFGWLSETASLGARCNASWVPSGLLLTPLNLHHLATRSAQDSGAYKAGGPAQRPLDVTGLPVHYAACPQSACSRPVSGYATAMCEQAQPPCPLSQRPHPTKG